MVVQEYTRPTLKKTSPTLSKACLFLILTFYDQKLPVWLGVNPDNPWN